MRIVELNVFEGLFKRKFEFSEHNNLIFSNENSSGKTTLLRCILYSMGYPIPPTKYFKFSKCKTKLILEGTSNGVLTFERNNENVIEVFHNDKHSIFTLPDQHEEVLKIIYGSENKDLLHNILGTHYVDQEKGWTLLNRGVVIGSIRFSIEELLRGLSDIDCTEMIDMQIQLENKVKKYKDIKNIVDYKNMIKHYSTNLIPEERDEYVEKEINELRVKKNIISNKLKNIDMTLKENKKFKKFVSDMCILVSDKDGNEIQVTSENIIGLNDSIDLLIEKRKMVISDLTKITKKINQLKTSTRKAEEQISFFESIDPIEIFDSVISNIPVNEEVINKNARDLKEELSGIRESIKKMSRNSKAVRSIYNSINKYMGILELKQVDDFEEFGENHLFTSNLKELSGAVLHKMVFAFKLAYILEVQNKLNIKLPIILDSPSGKEVDKENIQKMINILKKDFSENQIIIASIYEYDLPNLNIIKLHGKMIDEPEKIS